MENSGPEMRQTSLTVPPRCTCAKFLRRRTNGFYTKSWNFTRVDLTISRHLKTCPYWSPSQEVSTTNFSISHINLLFAKALSLSISVSNQAGWFSISPNLSLRGVVNESSPAFALLKYLKSSAYDYINHRPFEPPELLQELKGELTSVNQRIIQYLKEGTVSPYEVDERGRTMLHHALSFYYDSRWNESTLKSFDELVRTLLDACVPINEVDLFGLTTLDQAISSINVTVPQYLGTAHQHDSVCGLLTRHGAEFSGLLSSAPKNTFEIFTELQNLTALEPWQDITECGPLSSAILRQNEQDVVRILRTRPSSIHEINQRKQNPLHLAYCWPRGIKLLLDGGAGHLMHQADAYGLLPITYSAHYQCEDAAELLTQAGSALISPDLNIRGWFLDLVQVCWKTKFPSSFIYTLQDRRQKLFHLAKSTLPAEIWRTLDLPDDRLLDGRAAEVQAAMFDAGVEVPTPLILRKKQETVYHYADMAPEKADQLWGAGFKDVDSLNGRGKTPLMNAGLFSFVQWLLNKGADPHRERYRKNVNGKAVAGFTALHLAAQNLGKRVLGQGTLGVPSCLLGPEGASPSLSEVLFSTSSPDSCDCTCSRDGCTPFTKFVCAMRSTGDGWKLGWRSQTKRKKRMRAIIQHLESSRPEASGLVRSQIFEEIVRFETFEALHLHHTCCKRRYFGQGWRYPPEEVREIHEEEMETLQKHEVLVTEFCLKFEEHEGSIVLFLDDYWEARMEAVLKQEQILNEENKLRLREMGVVLKEVFESEASLSDKEEGSENETSD